MAKILDGKVVRDQIQENLKSIIQNLKSKPKLVIIQVGDNPESNTYIGQKIKFGERIGAKVDLQKLPADVSQDHLSSIIHNLNSTPTIHGIIIQMPISEHLNREKLIELIDPKKDVDGLTNTNQKLLEENNPNAIIPATAKGVISILNFYKIKVSGKKATVVGRSKLVGAPVATLLKNLGATVEIGHSKTPDLTAVTKPADIIVVAVGKPNLISKEHVSKGQAIVDVGINVVERQQETSDKRQEGKENKRPMANGKRLLVGDVNFSEVQPIVSAITPVPGGIGPMTVASLFENLLEAYKKQDD
ncbi:MAG: bifunctional 5,10-methylenetetrahydrofolate dehydrogenase/5,10-methenyltetrahydrofolate cyclohydrolase [Patescibacteria group bacterium]